MSFQSKRKSWEVDPFAGIIKDGYLYGRGAHDDKAMGIIEMMALLILKREKVPLKRDILFLATADEETGGKWGVEWAMKNISILKDSEYALNEGGNIILTTRRSSRPISNFNWPESHFSTQIENEGHIRPWLHAPF